MYSDPSQVRDHTIKFSLNDDERKLLQAAADKAGLPLATYCREAVMKAMAALLEKEDGSTKA